MIWTRFLVVAIALCTSPARGQWRSPIVSVVDPEGHPVQGAHVSVTDDAGCHEFHRTGPDGRVELTPCARNLFVTVRGDGFVTVRRSHVDALSPIRFELIRPLSVSGRFVDTKGVPVSGVHVTGMAQGQTLPDSDAKDSFTTYEARSVQATSDARGRFTLEGLPPGPVRLIGSSNRLPELAVQTVQAGDGKVKVVVTPEPVCPVRFVFEDGSPARTSGSPEGANGVDHVREASQEVSSPTQAFPTFTLTAARPRCAAKAETIQVRRGAMLQGRAPEGAQVVAEKRDQTGYRHGRWWINFPGPGARRWARAEGGRYQLRLAQGRYRLTVERPLGKRLFAPVEIKLENGQARTVDLLQEP